MKVLTLRQPWASLVALGVKTIETRPWSTQYRGPLAIHAAARVPGVGAVGDWGEWWYGESAYTKGQWVMCREGQEGDIPLPLGAIVATCTLVDVVPTRDLLWAHLSGAGWSRGWPESIADPDQRPYGDFAPGRYAYLLADIVPVDPPVPFKGGQGLTKTWEPVAA